MRSTVTIRLFRGDASGGREVDYQVETFEGMVVLDAIHQIQGTQDSSVACRWNCKAAKCGSCSAEVNGKPSLMCKTRVQSAADEDGVIRVHPLKTFPLIKDLVTDVSWNYRVMERIPPISIPADLPRPLRMRQVDVERVQEFRKCIECFLCQNVCHVLRDHNRKDGYFGPRFMVRIAGLEMHPLDDLERRSQLKGEAGVGFCNITKCCEDACPEHIKITDNAIIPLKERVADAYYDPVKALFRLVLRPKPRKALPPPPTRSILPE